MLNRILLSQVHARARKHTDTHKLACKSSLVRIRCPLSWENIWPHILFLRFAPPDHQLLTMFVYVQCTLDLVTLLLSTKTVTKSDNVTKYIVFM